jgi:hypothetical protein
MRRRAGKSEPLVRIAPQEFEGVILVRDFLDEVRGLDNLVRVASEMLLACALIIEREVGPDEACDRLRRPARCWRASAIQCYLFGIMAGSDLLAVIIGGAIGIAGSIVPHLLTQSRARASARASVRAYVSAILKMEEVRQHGTAYRQAVSDLRSGSLQSLPRLFGAEDWAIDETQKALTNQIGLLGADVASDFVLFCTMLDGLKADLKAIARGRLDDVPIPEKITIVEEDLKLWDDTQELGRKIVAHLR